MSYQEQIKILVEYLHVKVQERDWHGVSDAANDLRVLEARAENSPKTLRAWGEQDQPNPKMQTIITPPATYGLEERPLHPGLVPPKKSEKDSSLY